MKLAFLTLPFPGVSRIGAEGHKLGLWDFMELYPGALRLPDVDTYILGAWSPTYTSILPVLKGRTVGVCWTSTEMETALNAPVEHEYLRQVLKDPAISFIWFGDPKLAAKHSDKGFYLPYPIQYQEQEQAEKGDYITLFCPDKPTKNIDNQLKAVAAFQMAGNERIALHTNLGCLRNLDYLNVVRQPWLPASEYHQLLAGARANLACSLSETFCYQAAEAVLLGTPCVLSSEIPWARRGTVAPSDVVGMVDMLERCLAWPKRVVQNQRTDLRGYVRSAKRLPERLKRSIINVVGG